MKIKDSLNMAPTWSNLAPTLPNLALNMAPTWSNSAQLGPYLAYLGPTWPQLGPNLAPTRPQLAPTWTQLSPNLAHGNPSHSPGARPEQPQEQDWMAAFKMNLSKETSMKDSQTRPQLALNLAPILPVATLATPRGRAQNSHRSKT